MSDITLVQQAELSGWYYSCSLTMNNCTVGNTLVLAYVTRGSSSKPINNPRITDGWEKLGGGNNSDVSGCYQRLFFAKKVVESATETVTITQTSGESLWLICGEFSGNFDVVIRNDMANIGTSNYTVSSTKSNVSDVMLYGVTTPWSGSAQGQSVSPSDLTKLKGNSDYEQTACWFDDGSGALSHEFTASNKTGKFEALVECVQFIPKQYTPKYLLRSDNTIYTVTDGSLVEVSGELNANLFISSGVDEIPDGTLLMALSNPEVLFWRDEDTAPTLIATVTGVPYPQTIISDKIYLTDKSITGIENVLATCEGDLIVAVSFDDKQTWKAWNGEQWTTLSDDNTGMSKETLEGITFEQWNELYTGATGFYVRVSLLDTTQSVEKIVFDFSN